MLPRNTLCFENGMVSIDDINLCRFAAMTLRGTSVIGLQDSGRMFPKGCYKRVDGGVTFNRDKNIFRGLRNNEALPICQSFGL